MAGFIAPTPQELAQRRRELRRQRRQSRYRGLWRGSVLVALLGGSWWVMAQPFWLIRSAAQVSIQGATYLDPTAIAATLPIPYPQSLLSIDPQGITTYLSQQTPVATATVTRHLLPPRLEIWIQERQIAALTPAQGDRPAGLIDTAGQWVALGEFLDPAYSEALPDLVVQGYPPSHDHPHPLPQQWASLYPQLLTSPIPITALDWQDPDNLILLTELGPIHLGPYQAAQFPRQLQRLGQLTALKEGPDLPAWDSIDLRDPEAPRLQGVSLANP